MILSVQQPTEIQFFIAFN